MSNGDQEKEESEVHKLCEEVIRRLEEATRALSASTFSTDQAYEMVESISANYDREARRVVEEEQIQAFGRAILQARRRASQAIDKIEAASGAFDRIIEATDQADTIAR